jgi:hypothetical protein
MSQHSFLSSLDAETVESILRELFIEDPSLSSPQSRVLYPTSELTIEEVIVRALDLDEEDDEAQDALSEELMDEGAPEALARLHGPEPEWVVKCFNPSSMVSGVWGLRSLRFGGRGYLFDEPDSDFVAEQGHPLHGAWEPVESGPAFDTCFLATYQRTWDSIGLPPWMGETASGPRGLMVEAVDRVIEAKPLAWESALQALGDAPASRHLDELSPEDSADMAVEGVDPESIMDMLLRLRTGFDEVSERAMAGTLAVEERRALVAIFLHLIR